MKTIIFSVLMLLTVQANAEVFEIVVSKFKPGHSREKEMAMARTLNDFVKNQPGFIKRTLFYDAEQKYYVDLVQWENESMAKKASQAAEKSPICQPVFSQIEQKGMIFLNAEKVMEFQK